MRAYDASEMQPWHASAGCNKGATEGGLSVSGLVAVHQSAVPGEIASTWLLQVCSIHSLHKWLGAPLSSLGMLDEAELRIWAEWWYFTGSALQRLWQVHLLGRIAEYVCRCFNRVSGT